MIYTTVAQSPLGPLRLRSNGTALTGLFLPDHLRGPDASDWTDDRGPFRQALHELEEYFAGDRRVFETPLLLTGTPFQRAVWELLLRVPYGITRTYHELAKELGQPGAARAVGLANARNPISIFVPCHRVIGANGKLTGYAGGLRRKAALIEFERGFGWPSELTPAWSAESPGKP